MTPETAAPAPEPANRGKLHHRVKGGLVSFIGFLLSPLSWWNDLFVNVPLALAFAWVTSLVWPKGFTACFVLGYWLTNVLGLVMLQKGAHELLAGQASPYSRKALFKDFLVSLVYTLAILVLVKLGVLKPIPDYFGSP
jgi:hypothetical protein